MEISNKNVQADTNSNNVDQAADPAEVAQFEELLGSTEAPAERKLGIKDKVEGNSNSKVEGGEGAGKGGKGGKGKGAGKGEGVDEEKGAGKGGKGEGGKGKGEVEGGKGEVEGGEVEGGKGGKGEVEGGKGKGEVEGVDEEQGEVLPGDGDSESDATPTSGSDSYEGLVKTFSDIQSKNGVFVLDWDNTINNGNGHEVEDEAGQWLRALGDSGITSYIITGNSDGSGVEDKVMSLMETDGQKSFWQDVFDNRFNYNGGDNPVGDNSTNTGDKDDEYSEILKKHGAGNVMLFDDSDTNNSDWDAVGGLHAFNPDEDGGGEKYVRWDQMVEQANGFLSKNANNSIATGLNEDDEVNADRNSPSDSEPAPAMEFPAHWGKPPQIQTTDYLQLPGGYGHGSSTMANWIQEKLDGDKVTSQ